MEAAAIAADGNEVGSNGDSGFEVATALSPHEKWLISSYPTVNMWLPIPHIINNNELIFHNNAVNM